MLDFYFKKRHMKEQKDIALMQNKKKDIGMKVLY